MKDEALHVQMFGTFAIRYQGKIILNEGRTSESQFAYLMQLLLHHPDQGVSRDLVEQILFEDRDIEDVHHATRSVVYNAKQKLKNAGLPEANYIGLQKGVLHWTKDIPVVEDAARMEELAKEAETETDPVRKKELYLEACHLYRGEFLANQIGMVWVAQEARKYRALFCECAEQAVNLMREQDDYLEMEALGIYAAKLLPFSDWETVTMEAMVSLGRFEDAMKFYDDTLDLYLRSEGLRPSPRMIDLLNKLGTQVEHQYALLDEIQSQLEDGQESLPGGFLCSYPVFQGVYQMVQRMMERGGQSIYLMLCTVVDSKGNPMKAGPMLDELSDRLKDSICHSVRRSDAVCRYGKGQYLVLLINTTSEDCSIVQKRINERFIIGRQRTGIRYHVNIVVCSSEQGQSLLGFRGETQ